MEIRGAYAALVTPLTETGELNSEVLAQLLDHVIAAGVDGISVLGSAGECPSLTPQMRLQVVREAVRLCRGRVLVAAGIADSSAEAVVSQINDFADAGLDLAMVAPPFFYPINQEEVKRFFEGVAARTPLPMVLYHVPQMTKVPIEPSTAAYLSKNSKIVGLKDTGRNIDYTQDLVQLRDPSDQFGIVLGTDTQLVAAMTIGADGVWAASLNAAPELSVGIITAFRRGDKEDAMRLQIRLRQLVALGRLGTFPSGWKVILDAMGIPVGPPAWPTMMPTQAEVARIKEGLAKLGFRP